MLHVYNNLLAPVGRVVSGNRVRCMTLLYRTIGDLRLQAKLNLDLIRFVML